MNEPRERMRVRGNERMHMNEWTNTEQYIERSEGVRFRIRTRKAI